MSTPVVVDGHVVAHPGAGCSGCVLQSLGTGFMTPSGTPHSGVVLVGEALGAEEALVGLPFVGAAGFALTRLLRWMKLRREHFGVANMAWCRPPNNDIDSHPQALSHCPPQYLLPYLHKQRATFPQHTYWSAVSKTDETGHVSVIHEPVTWKPQQLVVVTYGDKAFRGLTGWSGISDFHGYVFWSEIAHCWVVPSLHPAYLLRGNLNEMLWARWELEKALELTKQPDFKQPVRMPLVDPPLWQVADYVGRYTQALHEGQTSLPVLTFDVENPNGIMTRIGFCFGPDENQTISLRWDAAYLPFIKQLLAGFGQKAAWNKHHDIGAVCAEGLVINGLVHDSMDAWHCLHSDLDKALVNAATRYLPWIKPWKHLFKTDMGFYNAMDAYANWVIHMGVMKDLQDANLWDVYWRHMVDIDRVTASMSVIGLQVDTQRQAEIAAELRTTLTAVEAAMQTVVPNHLKTVDPPNGFVKPPKDTTGLVEILVTAEVPVCSVCGLDNPLAAHFKGLVKDPVTGKKNPSPCADGIKVKESKPVWRWARREPFVPSTHQLLKYAKAHNHAVYKNYQTGSWTMDDEALVRMLKKHPADPLYPLVQQHRAVQKDLTTYVEVPVDAQGVLKGYRFNHKPSTLRFGCENPNMQNWPRDGVARSLIVARSGMVLWKRDYSAIEAVLVGYEAQDPTYIRMAKLGIHDWVLAHYLHMVGKTDGLPLAHWTDTHLKGIFSVLKATYPAEREMCKRIVHLSNYLGTAHMIFSQYPQAFGTLANCQKLQDFYFELFPKIRQWHLAECTKVEESKYVRNAYGYRHFFFAPLDYDKTPEGWIPKWGPDAKRLIAMKPQSNAAGIMKDSMLLCHDNHVVGPTLRLTIHDELFGECQPEELDLVQQMAKVIMERPLVQFPLDPAWGLGDYLSIGTEGAAGVRWSAMHKDWTTDQAMNHQLLETL